MPTDMRDLMSKGLKCSTAEYCEIRIEETDETSVRFRGNDIELVSQNISVGGNVRALHKGGWGFVSFNRLDNLAEKVEEACAQAKLLGDRLNRDIRLYPVDPVVDYVQGDFKKRHSPCPLRTRWSSLKVTIG